MPLRRSGDSLNRNDIKSQRRSLRLKDYGYNCAGSYFVTICTYRRENLFGEIDDGTMHLNKYGEIVNECFQAIAKHFETTAVDEFVVMPNHIHGIVVFLDVGARHAVPIRSSQRFGKPIASSLATIVGSFKSATTRRINELRQTPGLSVWQRNYHEHVIRNEQSLHRIREYIAGNPACWDVDRENPAAATPEEKDAWLI